MRRDISLVLIIIFASCTVAIAANLGWHKLDWIPPAPPPRKVQESAGQEPNSLKLTPEQVLDHLTRSTARFVDAREAGEYKGGHLAGALNLPSSAAYRNIDDLASMIPTDEKVIVYCGGTECEASHVVAGVLEEYEFSDVEIYTGGWEEIESSGMFDDWISTEEEF